MDVLIICKQEATIYEISDAWNDQRRVFFDPSEMETVPAIDHNTRVDQATQLKRIEKMYSQILKKLSESATEFNS